MQHLTAIIKKRPVAFSLVSNTCKTVLADIIAQKVIEKRESIDKRRTTIFATFGLVYLGGWQHFLFNKLFVRAECIMHMHQVPKLYQACVLTFLDLGVHTPLLYYPAFYSIKCVAEQKSTKDVLDMYKQNITNDRYKHSINFK